VLNALNTRLDPATIAFILEHGEAKVLITDREFAGVVEPALAQLKERPLVIDIDDELAPPGKRLGAIDYERFIARAIRISPGSRPPMSGTQSRSTTPRARPAIPRGSSITIAAPI